MGFWSGFEGLTGHRPGAFKGFSLKDILDKDMWERRERLGGRQSRQFEQTGVVPTTAWYTGGGTTGRGRPEMMGPRVGAAGVTPVDPASRVPFTRRQGGFTGPQIMEQVTSRNRLDRTMPHTQNVPGVAHTSAARPWANIQAQMLSDPRQGVSGMRIPPADLGMITRREAVQRVVPPTPPGVTDEFKFGQWVPVNNQADEKTVIQNFADPSKPNKITTTFETKEQPQPQPTSIMNMFNIDAWRDLARRKWEERMRARGGY